MFVIFDFILSTLRAVFSHIKSLLLGKVLHCLGGGDIRKLASKHLNLLVEGKM